MSAESSGVFTLKEINRSRLYRTSLNVASQRAVRPSTSVSATGNAADFLPVTVKADRLVWPADDVACVVTASYACESGSGTDQDALC